MKKKLFIIIGIILVLYITIVNEISSTKVAFSKPVLLLGILLIILGLLSHRIMEFINKSIKLKACYKVFKIGIILLISILIIIEGIIIAYPKYDKTDSDYILVLGAGLTGGKYPSLTLAYRLDAAIDCVNKYNNTGKIVVSGGQGNNEDIPEAQAMKSYLIDNGIAEDRILIEDKSSTTSENFKFSKKVIEENSKKSIEDVKVKIVTTDFHSFRSSILADKNGYSNITNYSGKTVWYLTPINYFRESLAVVKSILFD